MFTDDTEVSNTVPDNTDVFQKDLAWSESWQLRFNVAKCKVMHLGKQKETHTRVELESCQLQKDLGVNVDDDFKFR